MLRRSALPAVLLAAVACVPPQVAPPEDAGTEPPPSTCPAGTMLFPGEARCVPGDWASCADGFAPDVSGWGCVEVMPAQPCTGATREALGDATCRAIGDCAAPAPTDASLTVDAALVGPEDATHFRTLSNAVAAAPSGAKVFVRAGSYPQPVVLVRPIHIVGQCPAQVHLVAFGGTPVVRVTATGVTLEGLTLQGGLSGLSIGAGAAVVGRDLVIDGNGGIGVGLSDANATLTLSTSVIRNTAPQGTGSGWGLSVQLGSSATLTDCALSANHVTALRASGAGSTISATSVVVRDTASGTTNDWGRGAVAQRGASLALTRVAVISSIEIGVVVAEAATATLTDVVVRNTLPNSVGAFGRAINVADGSRLTLTRGTLSHNRDASLMVAGSQAFADVRDSVIYATGFANAPLGRGITVQEGAGLALSGSAVVGSREGGVVIVDDGSWGTLARCAIVDTALDGNGAFGHGLVTGLSTVGVRACQIANSAGIGLAIGPGSVVADALTLSANTTGMFVDNHVTLTLADEVPAAAGTDEAIVSNSTRFLGNGTNTAGGALLLPSGLFR